MAKEKATYEEWVKETREGFPPELQEALDKITNHEVGKKVFSGHLTEKEFYRRLNDLHTEKEKLAADHQKKEEDHKVWTQWYQEESPKVDRLAAERDALKAQLDRLKEAAGLEDDPVTAKPTHGAPDDVRKEIDALKQQIQFVDQALPKLFRDFGEVTYRTVNEKWNVKPGEVLDYSLTKRVDLNTAFNELTATERAERAATEQTKLIKEAEERGRREALKKTSTPDNLRPSGPTTFDNLVGAKEILNPRDRVSAAVNDWVEQVNSGNAPKGIGSL